jgi:branched-chain amino acid transport system substrate-binding protein
MRYMNAKKVPQLFVSTGGTKFGENPKQFPYTMGWQPNYQSEGRVYAKYLLDNKPDAKIGILYQNDDFGKDLLKGFKEGLRDKAKSMIVAETSYEVAEPTVDSHIVKLKASGADVFMNISTPKFAAQAIRKVPEVGWKPLHIVNNVAASVGGVLKPAGFENAQDLLTTRYFKDPTDPTWADDPAMKEWHVFLDKYYPTADRTNGSVMSGYLLSQTLVQVLKQCGDELTRDNVMKQAASLNLELPLLLPGVKIKTSPTDYFPVEQMQMSRFKGEQWHSFGPVLSGEAGD